MNSHEGEPTGTGEKAGFRSSAKEIVKNHWKKVVYPGTVVGALAYATFFGLDTVNFAANQVSGEENISGLVINRGVQASFDQKVNPIECEYDDVCPVDHTSFIQQRRLFVTIENCETINVADDTTVQTCARSTYATNQDTYDKATRGLKVEIPGGSRLVAFASLTK